MEKGRISAGTSATERKKKIQSLPLGAGYLSTWPFPRPHNIPRGTQHRKFRLTSSKNIPSRTWHTYCCPSRLHTTWRNLHAMPLGRHASPSETTVVLPIPPPPFSPSHALSPIHCQHVTIHAIALQVMPHILTPSHTRSQLPGSHPLAQQCNTGRGEGGNAESGTLKHTVMSRAHTHAGSRAEKLSSGARNAIGGGTARAGRTRGIARCAQ